MTGFGRFSVNEARKIINNFSVAPFVYSLNSRDFTRECFVIIIVHFESFH